MLQFQRALTSIFITLSCALMATHGHAQSQLRANTATAPAKSAAAVTGSQNPQTRVDVSKVGAVPAGELPTTDFGEHFVNSETLLPVPLGDRTVPSPDSAKYGGSSFWGGGDPLSRLSNLGKSTEPAGAPPSIRISGGHAGDFAVDPAQCNFVNKGSITHPKPSVFTCTVVYRPRAPGAHTALLEAMFPNGDRPQAVLKGRGQAKTVAMQPPGASNGSGLQASVGNQSTAKVGSIPETLDFGYVPQNGRKTLRVETQYPAGSPVLPRLAGAKIEDGKGYATEYALGEHQVVALGAPKGDKASFTITYAPTVPWQQHNGYFAFKDADGRLRKLNLTATSVTQ